MKYFVAGYGNQVPYYFSTRVFGCIIMIFGSLFISLPLAIIGNEYESAWEMVSAEALNKDEAGKTPGAEDSPDGRKVLPTTEIGHGEDEKKFMNSISKESDIHMGALTPIG
jgi:hypothetical protein